MSRWKFQDCFDYSSFQKYLCTLSERQFADFLKEKFGRFVKIDFQVSGETFWGSFFKCLQFYIFKWILNTNFLYFPQKICGRVDKIDFEVFWGKHLWKKTVVPIRFSNFWAISLRTSNKKNWSKLSIQHFASSVEIIEDFSGTKTCFYLCSDIDRKTFRIYPNFAAGCSKPNSTCPETLFDEVYLKTVFVSFVLHFQLTKIGFSG